MHTDLTQLIAALNLTHIIAGRTIVPVTETLASAAAVEAKLLAFGGDGWVCTADHVSRRASYSPNPLDPILSAELVNGDASLHILFDGNAWQLTTLREQSASDAFLFKHTHLALDGTALVYHTAWEQRPNAAQVLHYQPVTARLVTCYKSGE